MEYKKLGRFHIEKTIASGGMGVVVRSREDSGRSVALKTILESYQGDKKFRDMFMQEAKLTFELDHPNIVKAYRFEEVGNRLLLALEFLEGMNLKDILKRVYERSLKMPVVVAAAIAERVLTGLAYAHQKRDRYGRHLGIVHCDLNPANIFVTYKGDIKILDFGISKATHKDIHQLTPRNELRGKISYLSPEQIRGQKLDGRVDIFAMGIVLWECLAGRPLFWKDADGTVMEAICEGAYIPLSTVRDDVPEEIEAVIRKALSVNRSERFQDAHEFQEALHKALKARFIPAIGEHEISVFVQSLLPIDTNQTSAEFRSGLAFLLAQTPGQQNRAVKMAEELAAQFTSRPLVQLNFARVLMMAGDRTKGFRLLRKLARAEGLERDVHMLLEALGVRRPPIFRSLNRSNVINHAFGWMRHRMLGPTKYEAQFLAA